mmetsp:Transcript_17233/g.28920  ORF Transcript_17233/g.28920 Transcript_17233/m.28920 type:complete len:623 (+) Transcript_17233:779-2647(+)
MHWRGGIFNQRTRAFLTAHLFHRIASEVAAACRGQKMREEWLQSLRVFSIEGFAGLGTSPDSVDCGSNRPGVAGGNQQPTLNRYRLQSVSSTNQNPPFLQLQEMLGKAYDKLLQEFVMPGSPKELNISTALRDSLLSFSYQIDGAELAAAAIVSTSPRKTVVSSVVRVGSSRSSSSSKEATSSSFMAAISPMPVPSKALPPLVLTPPNHPRSSTSSSHKFSLFAPHTFQLPSSLKPNYSRKVTRRQPAASIFQASLQQRAVTGGKDSDQAPKTAPAATGRMSETHRVTERSSQLRMVVTPGRGMPPLEKKEAKEQRSELSFSAGNGGQRTTGTYFKAARSRLSSLLSGTTPSHEFLQLGQEQNEGLFATSSASSKPPLQQGGDADRPPQVKEKGGGKEAPGPFSPGAARGALRLAEAEVAGLLFRNMDVGCRGRAPEALKEVLLLAELDGALAGCGVQRVRKGGAAGHRAAAIAPAPVAQGIALAAPSSAVVAPAPPGWWDGPCRGVGKGGRAGQRRGGGGGAKEAIPCSGGVERVNPFGGAGAGQSSLGRRARARLMMASPELTPKENSSSSGGEGQYGWNHLVRLGSFDSYGIRDFGEEDGSGDRLESRVIRPCNNNQTF